MILKHDLRWRVCLITILRICYKKGHAQILVMAKSNL